MSALLSTDARPEMTPYYCGGCILRALKDHPEGLGLIDLFVSVKKENEIGSAAFVLGLDWLYLLKALYIDEEGKVIPCS